RLRSGCRRLPREVLRDPSPVFRRRQPRKVGAEHSYRALPRGHGELGAMCMKYRIEPVNRVNISAGVGALLVAATGWAQDAPTEPEGEALAVSIEGIHDIQEVSLEALLDSR